MIGESQLNVYIVASDKLSRRLKERIQAQVQSTLRAIPQWVFLLLRRRLQKLDVPNLPLFVEPRPEGEANPQVLKVGRLGDKPAVYLLPLARGEDVDWRQDRKHLVTKALAYLCAPRPEEDGAFWRRWAQAMKQDKLAALAQDADRRWAGASPLDLLMEMFAAYALTPEHPRWQELAAVRRFLEGWKATAIG